jgi:hypothetical protein
MKTFIQVFISIFLRISGKTAKFQPLWTSCRCPEYYSVGNVGASPGSKFTGVARKLTLQFPFKAEV